jgi:hypothetical protein
MIRVLVDHNVVTVPKPVTDVVIGSNLEEIVANVKAISTPPQQTIDTVRADGLGKARVFPGMIEMIMRIVGAGVMSDPSARVGVNARRFRMVRLIAITRPLGLLRTSLGR